MAFKSHFAVEALINEQNEKALLLTDPMWQQSQQQLSFGIY